jgi:hypothetical protein
MLDVKIPTRTEAYLTVEGPYRRRGNYHKLIVPTTIVILFFVLIWSLLC